MPAFSHKPFLGLQRPEKPLSRAQNAMRLVNTLLEEDRATSKTRGPNIRTAPAITAEIKRRFMHGDFQDIVTIDRLAQEKSEHRKTTRLKTSDTTETRSDDEEKSVSSEEDEEVKRMDFAESIMLNRNEAHISYSYVQTLKYFRYFLATNRQGTLITLIYIRHLNFRTKDVAQAFEDSQGTTLLLNLLSVDDPPVQIAAMRVLDKVSSFAYFARLIVHLGGIKPLLNNLHHPNMQMKRAAGKIISNLCILKKVRHLLAKLNAIKPIVCLLDENTKKIAAIHTEYERKIRLAIAFNTGPEKALNKKLRALERQAESKRRMTDSLLKVLGIALCAISKNAEGRLALQQAGVVSVFATLLPLAHSDVLESMMSTLQACCVDSYFRLAIWNEGMLPHLLECLRTANLAVKLPCTFTLSQCANEPAIRDGLRKGNGLDILARFLRWELTDPIGALENIRVSCVVRGQTFDEEAFVNSILRLHEQNEVRTYTSRSHSKVNFSLTKTSVYKSRDASEADEQKAKHKALGLVHETFLVGLTGLLWKASLSIENAYVLHEKGAISDLVRLVIELPRLFGPFSRPATTASVKLNGMDRAEKIVQNCLQAIAVAARAKTIRNFISKMRQGIKPWVVLLRLAIDHLVPATCVSLRVLLSNFKMREQFIDHGGLRLLFAYVSTKKGDPQREALQTIEACLKQSDDVKKLLKPLIGSASTIVTFAHSLATDEETQIAALDTIAQMARDQNTLAIMSDLGVIEGISRILTAAYSEGLKISVSRAVAACSYYGDNAKYLGEANCVPKLADFVRSKKRELRDAAVRALYGVSHEPENVARIWEAQICDILTEAAGSIDRQVQQAAAGTITNIRRLEVRATYSIVA